MKTFVYLGVGLASALLVFGAVGADAVEEGWEAEAAKIHAADPNPVDKGSFEWFVGYESARAEKAWDIRGPAGVRGGCLKDGQMMLGLTAGLGRNIDLGLSTGFEDCRDDACGSTARGFQDLTVGSKWKFAESKKGISAALLPSLTLPTGNRDSEEVLGVSQAYYSAGLGVVVVRNWKRGTANLDLVYGFPFGADKGDTRGFLNADLAFGWQPLKSFQIESELNYASDVVEGATGPRFLALTFGVLVPTEKTGRLQLAVQPTLSGRLTDKATSFHVAWVY